MNNKWSPWNWFKHESNNNVPVDIKQHEESSPISHLKGELDRLFDNAFSGLGLEKSFKSDNTASFIPRLDIQETEAQYKIAVEIPGIEEKDLEVHLDGDLLTIKGEKRQQSETEEGDFHRVERSYGSFCRMLNLPDNADQETISAKFDNGVLTLAINKREDLKPSSRQIEINKE